MSPLRRGFLRGALATAATPLASSPAHAEDGWETLRVRWNVVPGRPYYVEVERADGTRGTGFLSLGDVPLADLPGAR